MNPLNTVLNKINKNMEKVRFYIKTNNSYDCHRAKKILKKLGYTEGNFISTHCEGWVYGDDEDGIIKFLIQDVTSYPAVHAKFKEYRVFFVDNFPQEIIKSYKLNNIKKLITQPIVTKKEYRNTIEIAKEVYDHIVNNEKDYVLASYYNYVIKDLEKRYGM